MKSRVSSKGQVTIPVAVRDLLGLATGTPVEFVVREGEAILRKGAAGDDPVDRVYGALELDRPVDELIDEMRGTSPASRRRARPTAGSERRSALAPSRSRTERRPRSGSGRGIPLP